jgi:hypothetical protein
MTGQAPPAGRLRRWRLREPVRFYLWPQLFFFAVFLVGVAFSDDSLVTKICGAVFWITFAVAGEFARASVFSGPAMIGQLTRLTGATDRARLAQLTDALPDK